MIEKYKIANDIAVVAVKYNPDTRVVEIGGNKRLRSMMEFILTDAFNNPRYSVKNTQVNKVRFIFKKNKADFDLGLQLLRENNYAIEPVRQLGNIMR